MKFLEQMEEYDGLLIIHADFRKDGCSLKNLEAVTEKMARLGKPIFNYPSNRQEILISKRWIEIPNSTKEEELITQTIGKKPEDIRLHAGGMYAAGCVWGFLIHCVKKPNTTLQEHE